MHRRGQNNDHPYGLHATIFPLTVVSLSPHIFLHTDGTRSYKLGMNRKRQMDGVIHDYAIHKQKKINGKWVRPKFVQLFRHKMPDGTTVCTKGGTQIIDWFWRHLREHVGTRSCAINRTLWSARVRSAQWTSWNMGRDLWKNTGEMLKALA